MLLQIWNGAVSRWCVAACSRWHALPLISALILGRRMVKKMTLLSLSPRLKFKYLFKLEGSEPLSANVFGHEESPFCWNNEEVGDRFLWGWEPDQAGMLRGSHSGGLSSPQPCEATQVTSKQITFPGSERPDCRAEGPHHLLGKSMLLKWL